jgi:hypothetical protein
MNNFTLAMKQTLLTYCNGGGKVFSIAYDPVTVGTLGGSATPEADAIASGLIQWYKESTPRLVEVIYTSSVV